MLLFGYTSLAPKFARLNSITKMTRNKIITQIYLGCKADIYGEFIKSEWRLILLVSAPRYLQVYSCLFACIKYLVYLIP